MDPLVATVMIVGSVVVIMAAIIVVGFFSDREVVVIPEFTREDTPPETPRYVTDAERRFHSSNQFGR